MVKKRDRKATDQRPNLVVGIGKNSTKNPPAAAGGFFEYPDQLADRNFAAVTGRVGQTFIEGSQDPGQIDKLSPKVIAVLAL